jgi:hypothetical protein
MADIFISYARKDHAKTQWLASALEAKGWRVFWDRTIPPGKTWREYIGTELHIARCVIVIWSKASVTSEWVLEEADEGKERKILVPVLFDKVEPPLGFRSLQFGDLTKWEGDVESYAFEQVSDAVSEVIGSETNVPSPIDEPSSERIEAGDAQQDRRSQFALVVNRLRQTFASRLTQSLIVATLILLSLSVWYVWTAQEDVDTQKEIDQPIVDPVEDCANQNPSIDCLFRQAPEMRL